MSRRPPKRPPVAIQRAERLLSRMEMAQALELQAADIEDDYAQDMRNLATLLRSQRPEDQRCSPHTLAAKCNISFARIVAAFKEMKRHEAVLAVAQRLPKIADDIAVDAESRWVICPACQGEGTVEVTTTPAVHGDDGKPFRKLCIPCEGQKRVLRSGDPAARKQVLEMMALSGQHAVPINAPGANILVAGGGESLEQTLKSMRRGGSNGNGGSGSGIMDAGRAVEAVDRVEGTFTGASGEGGTD